MLTYIVTFKSLISMCAAILVGIIVTLGLELWWESGSSVINEPLSMSVAKMPDGTHRIRIITKAPAARTCLRVTQHILYRDLPTHEAPGAGFPRRVYVPMASTFTGLGFGGVPDYIVELTIPEWTEKIVWQFSTRSIYVCSVFPGISSVLKFATHPQTIDLSEAP